MKSDKLKLFIRKIVREEVAMAIHEVITELKQPSLSSKLPEKQAQKQIVEKNKASFAFPSTSVYVEKNS